MSESNVYIDIEFEGGLVLKGILDRVLAPLIVEDIKSRLPFEGRSALMRDEMKITLDINRGNLKPTSEVNRGNIAYMPLGDSLCIYLKDMRTFSPVNVLGNVLSSDEAFDSLRKVRRGSQASLRLSG
ncbi:MAG: cyclophilin-like family protein [Candidatus Thorarchaeota archaeon]|jgi:hypothetical protein